MGMIGSDGKPRGSNGDARDDCRGADLDNNLHDRAGLLLAHRFDLSRVRDGVHGPAWNSDSCQLCWSLTSEASNRSLCVSRTGRAPHRGPGELPHHRHRHT